MRGGHYRYNSYKTNPLKNSFPWFAPWLKESTNCHKYMEVGGPYIMPELKSCSIGNVDSKNTSVLMVGDSHAHHSIGMLDIFLKNASLKGYEATKSGPHGYTYLFFNDKNNNLRHILKSTIKTNKIMYFVMAGSWRSYSQVKSVKKGIQNDVKYLIKHNVTPVIILDTPGLHNVKRSCGFTKTNTTKKCFNPKQTIKEEHAEFRKFFFNLKKKYQKVILIDPSQIICNSNKCFSSINNIPLYFNEGHLNAIGSQLIGKLYLEKYGNPFGKNYKYDMSHDTF